MMPFLSETFTAANDTFITALDANWEEMPWDISGGTTANRPLVLSNQYRPHTANEPCRSLRWNVDPGDDEYDVTAVWTFQALQLSRQLAIFVRMTPSGSTAHGDMSYYRISCHGSTSPAFFINRVVSGSSTQIATEDVSLTAGTPIDVRVEVRSTGIEVYVDDTLLVSTDDTTITQRGRVGIGGHRGDGTGTTCLADNVIATAVTGATVVGRDAGLSWDIAAVVVREADLGWDTLEIVGRSADLGWDLEPPVGTVGRSASVGWDVHDTVGRSATAGWDVHNTAGRSAGLGWDVRTIVGRSAESTWDVEAIGAVGRSAGLGWDVHATVGRSAAIGWDVTVVVGRSASAGWDLEALAGRSAVLRWTVESIGPLVDLHFIPLAPQLGHGPAIGPEMTERIVLAPELAHGAVGEPVTAVRVAGEPEPGGGASGSPETTHGQPEHDLVHGAAGAPTV